MMQRMWTMYLLLSRTPPPGQWCCSYFPHSHVDHLQSSLKGRVVEWEAVVSASSQLCCKMFCGQRIFRLGRTPHPTPCQQIDAVYTAVPVVGVFVSRIVSMLNLRFYLHNNILSCYVMYLQWFPLLSCIRLYCVVVADECWLIRDSIYNCIGSVYLHTNVELVCSSASNIGMRSNSAPT